MIFSNFTKATAGNVILLKNTSAIENIQSVRYYKDDAVGSFSLKQVRWSFNNTSWSPWATLSQRTLSEISITGKYLYLEIRYTLASAGSGTINTFKINYIELPVGLQAPALPDPRDGTVTVEEVAGVPVAVTATTPDLITGLFTAATFSLFNKTTSLI